MPNYQNGRIYCIRNYENDDIYIGSTTQTIKHRFKNHKANYKRWLKKESCYYTSFEIIQYDSAYVELVEKYPCNCKEELEKREGEIIRETENCVNKYVAGRTKEEYYQEKKEIITKKKKEYYDENKEKVLQQKKEYSLNPEVKEHVKEYQKEYYSKPENIEKKKEYHKKYHKEYYSKPENKQRIKKYREKMKQKAKEYRDNPENKEKLKEKRKEKRKNMGKITCICGSVCKKVDIRKHERTKKHLSFISQNNNPV